MKAIYLNRDNRAQVFDVGVSKNIVEKHGYHPIPPNTIFRNAQNMDDAVCIIFQSRVVPYGDKQTTAFMELKQWEIYVTSLLDNKIDVDTELSRILRAFLKSAIPIGVMLLLVFVGLASLTQGGGI